MFTTASTTVPLLAPCEISKAPRFDVPSSYSLVKGVKDGVTDFDMRTSGNCCSCP
jgi:hypothetical protein